LIWTENDISVVFIEFTSGTKRPLSKQLKCQQNCI
jgi:hypothetical protein